MEIPIVVIDAMTFSYLKGLALLDLVPKVGGATRKLAVSKAVLMQVHRSGQLGALAQSYCDRGECHLLASRHGDDVSRAVADVLSSSDARLVRKNRQDIEVVEFARANGGAVLSRETGIASLAKRRHVAALDMFDFVAWAIHLGLITEAAAGQALQKWNTDARDGTGAPDDWAGTIAATRDRRKALPALLDRLVPPKVSGDMGGSAAPAEDAGGCPGSTEIEEPVVPK